MNNPFSFLSNIYTVNLSTKLQDLIKNPNSKFEDILDEDVLVQDFKDGKAHVVE